MNKKKEIYLLIFLIFLLFVINYSWLDKLLAKNFESINREGFVVERIIDGDTIEIEKQNNCKAFWNKHSGKRGETLSRGKKVP